jgi:hypothetical protein
MYPQLPLHCKKVMITKNPGSQRGLIIDSGLR